MVDSAVCAIERDAEVLTRSGAAVEADQHVDIAVRAGSPAGDRIEDGQCPDPVAFGENGLVPCEQVEGALSVHDGMGRLTLDGGVYADGGSVAIAESSSLPEWRAVLGLK